MSETGPRQPGSAVHEIDREALRARLGGGGAPKLIMASSDWAFAAKHIPGSLHFGKDADLFAGVAKDDDIVVYCSNVDCHASLALIQKLRDHGYQKVAHYAGGLIDWEEAGLPIEGDWASP